MDIDPGVISAVISGVVNLVTGYMTYRVGMQSVDQPKPDDQTIQKGEQVMTVVRTGVSQYGNEDEQADLASFERNPLRYTSNLERVLTDIASQNPSFAQQLQTLIQQTNLQASGVTMTASGDRGVATGGSVTGSTIITGDNNQTGR